MTPQEETRRIQEALAAPFPADSIGWKAQTVSGNRCLAVPYIDARDVQQRLDDVVGIAGWKPAFHVLLDGNVHCDLALKLGDEWIVKADVGGESDQPDMGDKRKAAYSDSLKRAAVQWGVGRYLYSLPTQWVDYDPQKKQIVGTPRLPGWALPRENGLKEAAPAPAPRQAPASMRERVEAADAAAVKLGLCKPGGLQGALVRLFSGEFGQAPDGWPEAKVKEAIAAFQADARGRLPATAEQTRAIDAELERAGETWARCAKKLKLPARAGLTDITQAQAAEVLAALKELTSV